MGMGWTPHPRTNRGWGWGWGSGVPCPARRPVGPGPGALRLEGRRCHPGPNPLPPAISDPRVSWYCRDSEMGRESPFPDSAGIGGKLLIRLTALRLLVLKLEQAESNHTRAYPEKKLECWRVVRPSRMRDSLSQNPKTGRRSRAGPAGRTGPGGNAGFRRHATTSGGEP